MLKLLKYDWKHNSVAFFATIAVLIVVEAVLLIGGFQWNWNTDLVGAFTFLAFLATAITLFVQMCKMFADNLKSFSRRLLPVSPYKEIASIVIIHLIYVAVILVLLLITATVMSNLHSNVGLDFIVELMKISNIISIPMLYMIWSTVNILILILFSISCSMVFKSNFRAWIGIIVFFVLATLLSLVSNFLFKDDSYDSMLIDGNTGFELSSLMSTLDAWRIAGTFTLELVFTSLLVYGIVYLMKNKIEL